MVGNVAFRGAAFGGFNRDDVMQYIEESAKKHADTVRDLRDRLEDANGEIAHFDERCHELEMLNAELKNQLEAQQEQVRQQIIPLQEEARRVTDERTQYKLTSEQLAGEKQLMEGRIEQMERNNAALQAQVDQLREVLGRRTEEANSLSSDGKEKDALIVELRKQIADMEDDHRNYLAICNRLGRIEAEMQSRATRIEEEAVQKAQTIMSDAAAYHDRVIGDVQQEAEMLRQQMQERLKMARTSAVSTSEDVNHSVTSALGEVSHIQVMLEQLSDCLSQQVVALHCVDLTLPTDPPVEEPVLPRSVEKREAAAV